MYYQHFCGKVQENTVCKYHQMQQNHPGPYIPYCHTLNCSLVDKSSLDAGEYSHLMLVSMVACCVQA